MSEPILVEDVLPEEEAVSIEEARAQCEAMPYGDSDIDPQDDAMFSIWIAAARAHCEAFLGLSLAPKVLRLDFDAFPSGVASKVYWRAPRQRFIELPQGPVRWANVDYGDESDELRLTQDEAFRIDRFSQPNRLLPIDPWPYAEPAFGAVRVTYGAGYGTDSTGSLPLPSAIKGAILLCVGFLYENRGNSADLVDMPKAAEILLRPLRVRLGMA